MINEARPVAFLARSVILPEWGLAMSQSSELSHIRNVQYDVGHVDARGSASERRQAARQARGSP